MVKRPYLINSIAWAEMIFGSIGCLIFAGLAVYTLVGGYLDRTYGYWSIAFGFIFLISALLFLFQMICGLSIFRAKRWVLIFILSFFKMLLYLTCIILGVYLIYINKYLNNLILFCVLVLFIFLAASIYVVWWLSRPFVKQQFT